MKTMDLDTILDMAIAKEIDANQMYLSLAERVNDPTSKDALLFLAKQEEGHKTLLEAFRRGEGVGKSLGLKDAVDYHIVEAFGEPKWTPELSHQDVFLLAARQEKAAAEFYQWLAGMQEPGEAKDLLERIAKEEIAHKEKVEYIYTNTAFPQTDGG